MRKTKNKAPGPEPPDPSVFDSDPCNVEKFNRFYRSLVQLAAEQGPTCGLCWGTATHTHDCPYVEMVMLHGDGKACKPMGVISAK